MQKLQSISKKIKQLPTHSSLSGRLFLFLFFVFFASHISARGITLPSNFTPPKAEDVIWLDSVSVLPLKVVFFPHYESGKKSLKGNISHQGDLKITHFYYQIKDSNGAIFWESKKQVSPKKAQEKSFDFQISPPVGSLFKNSSLSVIAYNKERVVGEGLTPVPLRNLKTSALLSKLVFVKKNENQSMAQFLFQNTAESDANRGVIHLEIYNRSGKKIATREKNILLLTRQKTQSLSIDFDLPEKPQLYEVKIFVTDEDHKQLGGVLTKNILKEGSFAEVSELNFQVDPKSDPVSMRIDFTGGATKKDSLTAEIQVSTTFDQAQKEFFKEQKVITINRTEIFEDFFEFPLKKSADQFEVSLIIKHHQDIIGEKKASFSQSIFVPGNIIQPQAIEPSDLLKTPKNIWWKKTSFWFVMLTCFIFFAALDNWFKWHNKWFLLALISFSFLNFQSANASPSMVWWTHPVASWFFNPSDASQNFQLIQFKGSILSTTAFDSDPLFDPNPPSPNGPPTAILLHFMGPNSEDDYVGISVDTTNLPEPDLTIENNVRFIFDLDLNTSVNSSNQPLASFLVDGLWQYQALFCMNGAPSDPNCTGGQWYGTTDRALNIDSTPPTLTFNYDGSAQPTITDGISVNRSSLDSSELIIKEALSEKFAKESEKKEKESLKTAKETTVSKKSSLVSKKQARVTYLESIIAKITEELDLETGNLGLTTEQRDYLLGKKNQFQQTKSTLNSEISTLNAQISTLNSAIGVLENEISQLDTEILAQTTIISNARTDSITNLLDFRTESRKHKNTAISVQIACDDSTGSNCYTNPNYDLMVKGNFCDNSTVCDNTETRKIKICDQVGNCTEPETYQNEIDWYDPLGPDIALSNPITNTISGSPQIFSLDTTQTEDIRRDTESPNDSTDYNTHACGENPNSPLYNDILNTNCTEKIVACATSSTSRGTQDQENSGACSPCPAGYIFDSGYCRPDCDQRNLQLCLPGILGRDNSGCVEDGTWLPDTNTVSSPNLFLQVSKCGKLRQAIGTQ